MALLGSRKPENQKQSWPPGSSELAADTNYSNSHRAWGKRSVFRLINYLNKKYAKKRKT